MANIMASTAPVLPPSTPRRRKPMPLGREQKSSARVFSVRTTVNGSRGRARPHRPTHRLSDRKEPGMSERISRLCDQLRIKLHGLDRRLESLKSNGVATFDRPQDALESQLDRVEQRIYDH